MDLPRPLRRVLLILGTALAVGAIGLGIGAMRSAAPTPVRAIGQAAGGETSQPGLDLQAMLNGVAKPPQSTGVPSPGPQSAIRLPAQSGGDPQSVTAPGR